MYVCIHVCIFVALCGNITTTELFFHTKKKSFLRVLVFLTRRWPSAIRFCTFHNTGQGLPLSTLPLQHPLCCTTLQVGTRFFRGFILITIKYAGFEPDQNTWLPLVTSKCLMAKMVIYVVEQIGRNRLCTLTTLLRRRVHVNVKVRYAESLVVMKINLVCSRSLAWLEIEFGENDFRVNHCKEVV